MPTGYISPSATTKDIKAKEGYKVTGARIGMADQDNRVIKIVETPYTRCHHRQREPHTCPYKEEISDNSESICTCCEECTTECAQDIWLATPMK